MASSYRLILVILLIFSGFLLILAGIKLIDLSTDLLLYLGIGLLTLAVVTYFAGNLNKYTKKGGE